MDFYLKTMTSKRESIVTLETNSIGSKRTKKKAKTHNGDYYTGRWNLFKHKLLNPKAIFNNLYLYNFKQ